MEVSKEVRDHIDRLIEQFQLEGRNILELPEQLTAALAVGVCRREGWLSYQGEDYSAEEINYIINVRGCWRVLLEVLKEMKIVSSGQLRRELMRLAWRLLNIYPGVTFADFSPLGEVMEYLLDAIFRKGNKNVFFTPGNIARLMIKLVQPKGGTLWDPACGSGAFLVEAARGGKEGDDSPDLFGTDINEQMKRIAKINAFFHGIRKVNIEAEDALNEQRRFDVIVANPPVIAGRRTDSLYGHIAPTTALHLQFLQMIPEHLTPEGRAAVLVNESVLFSTKRTETTIREALVEQYHLWAVLSLPKGVFAPYTNAKASILLFGGGQRSREGILFYELHRRGNTPGREQVGEEEDISRAEAVCAESDYYFDKWDMALQAGSAFNADGIAVPEDWQEDFWFAGLETVRENGYVLLPARYCPQRQNSPEVQEDYRELLDRLLSLEREAGGQIQKLAEIFQRDWM